MSEGERGVRTVNEVLSGLFCDATKLLGTADITKPVSRARARLVVEALAHFVAGAEALGNAYTELR